MKLIDKFQVAAPTRADLAGGTLDLWPLYCLTGTARTINVALNLLAVAEFEVAQSQVCKIEVIGQNNVGHLFYEPVQGKALKSVPDEVRFPVYVISQYLAGMHTQPHLSLRVQFKTQAPRQSGLGGSSALLVALARGLSRVFSQFTEQGWQWKCLDWVKDVEAAYLRIPTGTQDYLAALFGNLHSFVYRYGTIACENYAPAVFDELSERLVVIYSGEQHNSGVSNWEVYKSAIENDAAMLKGLSNIRGIADELDLEFRVPQVCWARVGKLFDEEWKVRRETFKVNTPTLDRLVTFLNAKGALGTKVCGAAQGGSLIALVDPEKRAAFQNICAKEGLTVLSAKPYPYPVLIQSQTLTDAD